ncbi:MAG: fasciclin domain-containing protein [bacterium]|nr:fasciclin domain-containing protein [bacterium]
MIKRFGLLILSMALCGLGIAPAAAQDSTPEVTPQATAEITPDAEPAAPAYTRVRLGHYVNGAAAVDVYLNDEAALRDVPYPATTNYLTLAAGTFTVTVTRAGAGRAAPLIPPFAVELAPDRTYTLAYLDNPPSASDDAASTDAASADDAPYQLLLIDENAAIGEGIPGTAQLIVLNAVPGASLAAAFGGAPPLAVGFGARGVLPLSPGDTTLAITLDTGARLENTLSLRADLLYFIVVHGEASAPQPALQVSGTRSLAAMLRDSADFSLFYRLIDAVALTEALEIDAPFTVFAPTNTAIEAYAAGQGVTVDALAADADAVNALVRYHIARGLMFSDSVASLALVPMLNGGDIRVDTDENGVLLNDDGRILMPDVLAMNGVVHVVTAVLTEPAPDATPEPAS